MTAIIHSERQMDPRQRVRFALAQPRKRTTAGSRIADLVALEKAVSLCPACRPRFNALQADYRTYPNVPQARGTCDGCGEGGVNEILLKRGRFPR